MLYVGGSHLFRSTNEGQSFDIISPPLARNDPKTLGASGGPITKDQTGVETYGTIFTFAESPLSAQVLWVGTDDGWVQLSRDGGKTWTNVTPKGSATSRASRSSMRRSSTQGTAYIAANRFQLDDFTPSLWKTTDFGATWTKIVNGIAADEFTRVIREDPGAARAALRGHRARCVGVVQRRSASGRSCSATFRRCRCMTW